MRQSRPDPGLSRPDSGLGSQAKVLQTFKLFPGSAADLGVEADEGVCRVRDSICATLSGHAAQYQVTPVILHGAVSPVTV